ncbi:MAG TPA: M48 family metalloprotease [Solirubrobacteraceae bacterium]|jgi:STE24 endopeptidase
MSRAGLVISGLVIAVICAVAGIQLWDTVVPTDLKLDTGAASRAFKGEAAEDARSFEALMRWLFIATQLLTIATLFVYARRAGTFLKESAAGPIGTGFLMGMMGISIVWLVSVPFGLVETWWARKHDALEANYLDYLLNTFFALTGEAVSLCVVLLIAMGLARLVRSAWFIPSAVTLGAVILLLAWGMPYLYPGLEEPPNDIATDARPLAEEQDVEDVPVRVENVSEYISQPNAFAMGLGDSRKIVLWDTLVDDFDRDEVRSVVSHEYGHHEHDHIAKGIGWSVLFALPAAFVVMLLTRRWKGGLANPAAVPTALLIVVVLQLVTSPITSGASRRYEAEADWAALQATKDPQAMVDVHRNFTEEALSDPDPPEWFHWMFDSHPSGAERVAMARAWRARNR